MQTSAETNRKSFANRDGVRPERMCSSGLPITNVLDRWLRAGRKILAVQVAKPIANRIGIDKHHLYGSQRKAQMHREPSFSEHGKKPSSLALLSKLEEMMTTGSPPEIDEMNQIRCLFLEASYLTA